MVCARRGAEVGRAARGEMAVEVVGGEAEALFCDAARTLPDRNAASASPVHIFYLALTHTGLKLRAVINETKLLI